MAEVMYNGKVVHGMSDWKTSIENDFKVGDYVSSEIMWEIAECVPPRYFSRTLLQCGEPYGTKIVDGKAHYTYTTFVNVKGGYDDDSVWEYRGHCMYKEINE